MSTYAELFLQQLAITYEDSVLLTNTCSAAVYSYFTENELENNLNREAFLYYYSGIFDALPFMIVGTRSTRAIPSTRNVSFSKLHYWTITHPFLVNDDNSPNCHLGYGTSDVAFGVSHGSYISFFRRSLIAIGGVYGNNISWPVDQKRVQAIYTGFEWPQGPEEGSLRRLPDVIGALDGKNVIIELPKVHPEHWRDRKDSAYALSSNVIVPYPITETIGNSPDAIAKRRFNKVHSSARMTVERAFGLLSARWRFISKHVYMRDITDVCYVITAACILHSICINIDDPDFDFQIPNEMGSVEEEGEDEGENENEDNIPRSVRARRDELNRWFSTQ
ncbi:hypothetical protein HPULCUR_004175 [Helicostylum pulchrum]|uniref:DDE Tnp4 domain-containing protein n=1 Tax=Helicostylum pulchrum TaxID=562976 RepID=A0ABP9XVH0_9FUNG